MSGYVSVHKNIAVWAKHLCALDHENLFISDRWRCEKGYWGWCQRDQNWGGRCFNIAIKFLCDRLFRWRFSRIKQLFE